ncbi:uncharacterized protein LOC114746575 [Neltuma alba]|uniref:uncharacterized protein LOC114746193 n=1 Tax=Neltuma alba TaxID=207710 RepID=UPI0010A40DC4|nr:uncharacterized protein LOC114746193 [Prosopis alba]XP_028790224.1 uncharacterized protein LOC114746193 [Prosopis alba]XP_028790225.1 uncharacterized protein LOC114746193 [Prosopis alba]XP_028790626.1 uncharacterized protein LOC114746575 [Prosopis alba]XP_028790627.1 uncharacterized protein LOC114746575 [Prosopis alba]XP_028790628.1 uncharacterized protein LOC114746575 [Prosopis alba]
MDEWKRSGQIPAFGNWDLANDLPITQYFECARQAGLVRHSSSSGESDPHACGDRDLYALDFKHHVPPAPSSIKKMRRKRSSNVKENGNMNMKKQGKVWDVREAPGKAGGRNEGLPPPPPRRPKPVDQDLYQIPPEVLRTSKRSKMLGFISKCLLPRGCVS